MQTQHWLKSVYLGSGMAWREERFLCEHEDNHIKSQMWPHCMPITPVLVGGHNRIPGACWPASLDAQTWAPGSVRDPVSNKVKCDAHT